jgi:hypothetical protein
MRNIGGVKSIGLTMSLTPELELTIQDPDCQVTDKGWMPDCSTQFEFTEEHCLPSSRLNLPSEPKSDVVQSKDDKHLIVLLSILLMMIFL